MHLLAFPPKLPSMLQIIQLSFVLIFLIFKIAILKLRVEGDYSEDEHIRFGVR